MTSMEPIHFNSEGLEIHGVFRPATGAKPEAAVVFCHGAFEFQDNWFDYAQRLQEEGFTTFTFDFAGHGLSQGVRGGASLRLWAYNIRDALNYLATRGFNRFGLVGWDSGGSAALLAAAHDPRVSCLVVLSAPVYLSPPFPDRLAYGSLSLLARVKKRIFKRPTTLSRLNELENLRILSDDDLNQLYFSDPRVRETYAHIPIPESLDNVWLDITQTAKKVRVPVRIIHAKEDEMLPVEQSSKLFALLRGKKDFKLVPGRGHALHLDLEKEEVFNLIASWNRKYLKPAKTL